MEWLEGVGEAGGHAGQRQAAGGVRGGLLRYQVLLTLLALDVLGLGAGHVHVCGVRAVLQQVVEGVQVVLPGPGGNNGRTKGERKRERREMKRQFSNKSKQSRDALIRGVGI